MKKIFTLMAAAAMSVSALTANAETCPFYLCDYYFNYLASPVYSEITKNDDGSYTIDNFMNSGKGFTFSFPELAKGQSAMIETDDYMTETGYTYPFFYSERDYFTFNLTKSGTSDAMTIYDPYFIYEEDYSYIGRNSDSDAASDGYEYYACITLNGYMGSDYTSSLGWSYLWFYFGAVESSSTTEPATEIGRENVTIYTEAWNDTTLEYYTYANPITTELVSYDDGSYSFPNFMNSNAPFSFKFDEPAEGASNGITLTSGIDSYGYLKNGSQYVTLNLTDPTTSSDFKVYAAFYDSDPKFSYVYRYNATEAAQYGAKYFGELSIAGFLTSDYSEYSEWMYVGFDFGAVSSANVNEITTADNDAPVEYYNLNGLRVENPENGLYIRKQGSKVTKVMVK